MPRNVSQCSWLPLLTGNLKETALGTVEEIAEELRSSFCVYPIEHPAWSPLGHYSSLSGGKAGLALFFAYLDKALPGRGYDDTSIETLESAIEGSAEVGNNLGLFAGLSGTAWVIEHLREQIVDPEGVDPNQDVVLALGEALLQSGWEDAFDLISGLTGLGVFALERLPHPSGADCVQLAIDRLSEIVDRGADGGAWRTSVKLLRRDLQALFPAGEFNLGVAHGVPGVIAFLGEAFAEGFDTLRLLERAVDWILSKRLPEGMVSCFPYRSNPSREISALVPARLAWCYGDIGISVALLAAARATKNAAWEHEAREIGRFAAARRIEDSEVFDAGLCHGMAGIAHLFNRLFQATGEVVFERAALEWFSRTLSFRRVGQGIGGFLTLLPGAEKESWQADPGFLMGAAGIGLAILAAITPVPPLWDRLLLSDIRPRFDL